MNDDPPSPPAAPPNDNQAIPDPAARPAVDPKPTIPGRGRQGRDPAELFGELQARAVLIETTAFATARRAGMSDLDATRVAGRVTADAMHKIERLDDPVGYAAVSANAEVVRIIRKTAFDAARRSRASPDDAEDVAQEVVIRVIAVPLIRSNLLACTRRAVRRLLSNRARDRRRRSELLALHVEVRDLPTPDLELILDLARAAAELPAEQIDAVRRAGAGESRQEIARAQCARVNTASSRVRLARRHFAKAITIDE